MAWRSVVITQPSRLRLEQNGLVVEQDEGKLRIPLEDISVLVIDQPQVSLSAKLLSACASGQIAVITVDDKHLPNGVLLPHLPHSRALKIMRAQLDMSLPRRKQLWRGIVQRKLLNQAEVLAWQGHVTASCHLQRLAKSVRSGDAGHAESHGAQVYFRHLFGAGFSRAQERFHNAAFNYGYSVIRSTLARNLVAYGFLTAFGLHHSSEQNAFNLADDLIEPFRPILDAHVLTYAKPDTSERELTREDKAHIVSVLHQDVLVHLSDASTGKSTLLAAAESVVISLSQRLNDDLLALALPSLNLSEPDEGENNE
ncbi:type II CRISPR-associated endonuclease Cas1 [Halothiobacillus sp.]|uniref:type II CRISPR-associated endonuclease Cas1 n=1 Tax=Halothiobacillus sp. TaxID=1891311 RepID=UPI002617E088|nr:type II CRISPR-associated endonuclease Cas1 [Halothiobacillus sp.]